VIFQGRGSIALFPFWRFDAKGGEVVLLGYPRDLQGSGTSQICFYASFAACVPFILVLNHLLVRIYIVELCVCVDVKTYGIMD
jgi:hypothetical protein